MIIRVLIGVAIGMGVGALMGHFGQCSSGACPLTANPFRGAIYGGVMGFLFTFFIIGKSQSSKGNTLADETGSSNLVHVNSEADFNKFVLTSKLPCLVDFYSNSCGPCRMLAPTLEKLAVQYGDRAVICKVSVDKAPALTRTYKISGIPAVLFFNQGKEVKRIVGFRFKSKYENVLDEMIAKQNVTTESK